MSVCALIIIIIMITMCTSVLQSHEREQSLRVQLEESKEIATTATTTTNGLKMMLHNKAKIIDLNKT